MKPPFTVQHWLVLVICIATSTSLDAAQRPGGGGRGGGQGGGRAGGQAGGGANGGGQQNQPGNKPAAAVPQIKFKDLPVNTEFYFATDLKKSFLKLKVSETMVRTVATGEELGPVVGDSLVVKKDGATAAPAKKTAP